jgi:predicted nucleic acid-binding protein
MNRSSFIKLSILILLYSNNDYLSKAGLTNIPGRAAVFPSYARKPSAFCRQVLLTYFCRIFIMRKFIIDTCVWRDFFEDRVSREGRHIGMDAFGAFLRVLKKDDMIIYSDLFVSELKSDYGEEEIENWLGFLFACGRLVRISPTKEETCEAAALSRDREIPFGDCIFAVMARNHGATVVTRDRHFFKNLRDITKAIRPEELY